MGGPQAALTIFLGAVPRVIAVSLPHPRTFIIVPFSVGAFAV